MWKAGHHGKQEWACRVKEAARNEQRIRVSRNAVFVGRAHQFNATKPQVKNFINNLRRNADGTHV